MENTQQEKREANRFEARPDGRKIELFDKLLEEVKARRKRGPVAYLGHVSKQLVDGGKRTIFEPMIHVLPLGNMHGSASDLQRYIDRGFILLDWWLPEAGQIPAPSRRGDAQIEHGWALEWKSTEAQDRIRGLKAMLQKCKSDAVAYSGLVKDRDNAMKEREALQAQVEEMKAKLAKEVKPRGQ
jgi:hypothetical protein